MKRVHLLLTVGLLAVGFSWGVSAATRGPIEILGDAEFTQANGVVGGSGIEADPYLIAGHEIAAGVEDPYGIRIENTMAWFVLRGVVVQGATATGGAGIRIANAENGSLETCTVSGALNGIELLSSSGVRLRDTTLYVNGMGLRVTGDRAEHYAHDIDATNTINGRQILYYYGIDGQTVTATTSGHLTVAGSRGVTVSANDVVNGDGIVLAFVTDSTITANEVYRTSPVLTEHGIFLYRSTGNLVAENSLRNNRLAGLQLTLSSGNRLLGNDLLANDSGIRLVASDQNVLDTNVLYANVSGMVLSGGSDENEITGNILYHENTKQGITLEMARANVISRNGLANCEVAVTLGPDATENVVSENTMVRGAYGLSVYGSSNRIERNLIAQQARGLLCVETFGRTTTRGNQFIGNVFTDNNHHAYLNLDSEENAFGDNAFLGDASARIADQGTGNSWTLDGKGNYYGDADVVDANGDGRSEMPVTVYPSGAVDVAPLARFEPVGAGLGILSGAGSVVATLARGDGSEFEMTVVVADDGVERWAGFRGFPADFAARFPGIVFVFDDASERLFTMSTVLFDLDIAFFDAAGNFVSSATMSADTAGPFAAAGPFQVALELPSGSLETLRIGEGSRLILP
ncbi:MAG: NosD domain-containing protein [Candidatus Bipolaricaulota bacterium]